MKSVIGILALVILLLAGLGLGLSNAAPVSLGFMGFNTPALPFFVWILLAIALGAIFSGILGWFRQRTLRREIKRLNKALQQR